MAGLIGWASMAFKIWMLVDAARRSADVYWYFIIFMPFGDVVYFFVVKIQDEEYQRVTRKIFPNSPALNKLRHEFKQTPSTMNRLALAQALLDRGKYAESLEHFHEVLKADPANKVAQFGAGSAAVALKQDNEAIGYLEQLVKADSSFADFAGSGLLAEIYWRSGQRERATEFLEQMVKKSSRLKNKLTLAKFYIELGHGSDAKKLLQEALDDYKHAPKFIKRLDRRYSWQSRRVLRQAKPSQTQIPTQ
jgi:hypothetical protein